MVLNQQVLIQENLKHQLFLCLSGMISKSLQLTQNLLAEGVFVNPVVSPAVPKEDCLIRYSLMATHTKEQVEISIEKITKAAKALHILS